MIKSTENSWVPTPKQTRFLSIPFSVKEAFYAGAVGAGKSDILLLYPIIHRLHENPKFKGLFLRRTFPELKEEIIPRSQDYFRKLGASYNKNDKLWEFPSGALFFFGHCENEDDVHKYDSMQPNYVAFDELTSFTEWQYLYITLQRVRTIIGSNLPAIVRSASNPGNIGHAWVRKRFIDPCPEGGSIIQSKTGLKRIFIPATVEDNPYIDPAYKLSLLSIPDRAERESKLYGKWDAYEGMVFEEFRDRNFPEEPEHALHVIDEFEIPDWWPKLLAIDWGFAPPAMTYACWGAISPDKRVYIYRENFWQKTHISSWTSYLKELVDLENPRQIKLCYSAGQNRGQEHTVESEISEGLGRTVELSDNRSGSRISGKMLLHEYLRWKQNYIPTKEIPLYSEEYALWLHRNRSESEYRSYLRSYTQDEVETLPKLQIFSSCKLLINAIKSCSYDKTHPQDVAEFPGDDPYDTIRYLIDAADRYFEESSVEYQKLLQTQSIINKLNETQDWTSFYRNAQSLEFQDQVRPVRRYHRGQVSA